MPSIDGMYTDLGGGQWAQNTQLTGRNVVEVTAFNALAIIDINVQTSSAIDVSKYKSIRLNAYTTLNQTVKLGISFQSDAGVLKGVASWDGTAWKIAYASSTGAVSLTANDAWNDLSSFWSWLSAFKAKTIKITAKCDVAPTAGSLTLVLEGDVN